MLFVQTKCYRSYENTIAKVSVSTTTGAAATVLAADPQPPCEETLEAGFKLKVENLGLDQAMNKQNLKQRVKY